MPVYERKIPAEALEAEAENEVKYNPWGVIIEGDAELESIAIPD